MTDFAEEIRRRVAAAREAAGEQGDQAAQRPQDQTDQVVRRKSRVAELATEIDQRFREAAEHSSGAMTYHQQADTAGRSTAVLSWRSPTPARDLRVYVNPLEGIIEWSWTVNRVVRRGQRVDPLTFDTAKIDELIFRLSDQEAWRKGEPPA